MIVSSCHVIGCLCAEGKISIRNNGSLEMACTKFKFLPAHPNFGGSENGEHKKNRPSISEVERERLAEPCEQASNHNRGKAH